MRDWTWTSLRKADQLPGLWARALEAANRSPRAVLCAACVALAAPAICVGWDAMGIGGRTLGVNPLETLIRTPGRWAFIWLLSALAMAPLRHALVRCAVWGRWRYGRRLSDWNWFIRLRRQVGLACYFYAATHVALYVCLDLDLRWSEFTADLQDKPYIGFGIAAFLLLLPLAMTSTDAWMRRLQRNWKRLHMLVYPAAILAMAHFLWLTKPGITDPVPYGLVLAVLLAWRGRATAAQRSPAGARRRYRAGTACRGSCRKIR